MSKDVLGKKELESLKLNWNFVGPGLMDGRCYATGTCDSRPTPIIRPKRKKPIQLKADDLNIEEIKLKYGYLRFKK